MSNYSEKDYLDILEKLKNIGATALVLQNKRSAANPKDFLSHSDDDLIEKIRGLAESETIALEDISNKSKGIVTNVFEEYLAMSCGKAAQNNPKMEEAIKYVDSILPGYSFRKPKSSGPGFFKRLGL